MKFDKLIVIFLLLSFIWYALILIPSYNWQSNIFGQVDIGNGRSWPLYFFIADLLVIILTGLFFVVALKRWRMKKLTVAWILLFLLLIVPWSSIFATLQDIIFSPIARL